MNTEIIDKVVEYTKQFIEAAAPVAKQAYEVGLLTLRLDALASLVPAIIVLILMGFAWKRIFAAFAAAKDYTERANRHEPGYSKVWSTMRDGLHDHLGWYWWPVSFFCSVATLLATIQILSLWAWVKLFAPELWLAHQAIDKLIK